jgi:hypothetical protein
MEKGFKLLTEELPKFGEGIGMILEDGSRCVGRRERHPVYKEKDCYVVDGPHNQSKIVSWIYISDLIKMEE